MAKEEQVTEVVRQVAMVEEALGRLEQGTLAELWGEQNSWLAEVVLLAFLVVLPPFMPGPGKKGKRLVFLSITTSCTSYKPP